MAFTYSIPLLTALDNTPVEKEHLRTLFEDIETKFDADDLAAGAANAALDGRLDALEAEVGAGDMTMGSAIRAEETAVLTRMFPAALVSAGLDAIPSIDVAGTSSYRVLIAQESFGATGTLRRVRVAATRSAGTTGVVRVGAWKLVGGELVLQREQLVTLDQPTGLHVFYTALWMQPDEYPGIDLTDFGPIRSGGSDGVLFAAWRGNAGSPILETDATTARLQLTFDALVDAAASRAYVDSRDAARIADLAVADTRLDVLEAARTETLDASGVHPGEPAILVADAAGNALAWVDDLGQFRARLGDNLLTIAPEHPADPWVVIEDAAGNALIWLDPDLTPRSVFGGVGSGAGITRPKLLGWEGNAWQVIQDGTSIRWLSDAYVGGVIGFERRAGLDLAETGETAVGMVAYGAGMLLEHTLAEDWRWHVRRPDLGFTGTRDGAEAMAALAESEWWRAGKANPTVITITSGVGSAVEADLAVTSAAYASVLAQVTQAKASLVPWGKGLSVDRIAFRALTGAPTTTRAAADLHYASVAAQMRSDIVAITGQGDPPLVVVTQGFGTRTDGASETALAEGSLDTLHPTTGFVVVGPRWVYPLLAGSSGNNTPNVRSLMRELAAFAVAERQAGRQWYCPSMLTAVLSGSTITVTFAAMTDLVMGPGAVHGFTLEGVTNGATITGVALAGKVVTLTLSAAPTGTIFVRYAWGMTGDAGDGFAANRGVVRDQYERVSVLDPTWLHHRFALSGRVALS